MTFRRLCRRNEYLRAPLPQGILEAILNTGLALGVRLVPALEHLPGDDRLWREDVLRYYFAIGNLISLCRRRSVPASGVLRRSVGLAGQDFDHEKA